MLIRIFTHIWQNHFENVGGLNVIILGQRLANFFCKGPNSESLGLRGP